MKVKAKSLEFIGYGDYFVSKSGSIYRKKQNGKVIKRKLSPHSNGYVYVALCEYGIYTTYRVHRLVAMAFIKNDNPNVKTFVNHKDGNKSNNHAENLEWISPSDNNKHAYSTGLWKPVIFQKHSKPVSIYDLHTNKLLHYHVSTCQAARIISCSKSSIQRAIIEANGNLVRSGYHLEPCNDYPNME